MMIPSQGSNAYVGVDLGGTCIKFAVIDDDGKVLFADKTFTQAKTNRDTVFENIVHVINTSIHKASSMNYCVKSIGCGTPGIILNGVIASSAENIAGWQGFELQNTLKDHFKLPVCVGNDTNYATIGELKYGAAKGARNMLMLTLGTGIGGGVIVNGELYTGFGGAGEFGYTKIATTNSAGKKQSISWESVASASALTGRFIQLSEQNDAKYPELVTGEIVFDEYHKGNSYAKQALDENIEWLGIGIANLYSNFDPDMILLGGGISEAGEFYVRLINDSIIKNLPSTYQNMTLCKAAKLGNKAGSIGAAHMASTIVKN